MPGTFLGTGDTVVNKMDKNAGPHDFFFSNGGHLDNIMFPLVQNINLVGEYSVLQYLCK